MWSWYAGSEKCIAYLYDVRGLRNASAAERLDDFRNSNWFTRGWTLQELLAPNRVLFLDRDWWLIGWKNSKRNTLLKYGHYAFFSPQLNKAISQVTGISLRALWSFDPQLSHASEVDQATIVGWTANRQTTKPEDSAYCMLGIFGVHMPLIYGEGTENAWDRLKEEIEKKLARQAKKLEDIGTVQNA